MTSDVFIATLNPNKETSSFIKFQLDIPIKKQIMHLFVSMIYFLL